VLFDLPPSCFSQQRELPQKELLQRESVRRRYKSREQPRESNIILMSSCEKNPIKRTPTKTRRVEKIACRTAGERGLAMRKTKHNNQFTKMGSLKCLEPICG